MLVPAISRKDELSAKFAAEVYTERYFYYVGYAYGFELPEICTQDCYYQWAIVDDKEDVIGYLAYRVDPSTDTVDRFGLYSFDEGNLTVIKDTFEKLEHLIKQHHRVEWRVIGGNHAKNGYDRFCKKWKGRRVCLHDVVKDLRGNYRNEYIYEIIRQED